MHLNYILNKFCPYIAAAVLLFFHFDAASFEPYVILAAMIFVDKFNYKVGYAVGFCESKGINLEGDD
tara:strand:+ start:253 stop:453 length:201 start_codon:yes stop_codon:yes gene_type:complete